MVSDSSKCSGLSLSTGADRENARDDTTSLASELGVETATRVPASALRLRVAGNAVRTAVRRPRRACERRALANILVLVERDVRNFPKTFPLFFPRSSPYHVPHQFGTRSLLFPEKLVNNFFSAIPPFEAGNKSAAKK